MDGNRRILGAGSPTPGPTSSGRGEGVSRGASRRRAEDFEVAYTVGTGYGRYKVPFGDAQVTEIGCHARGASFLFPATRTILDIGGQDTKAIKVRDGEVADFCMTTSAPPDRAIPAAAAEVMGVPLEEIGEVSLRAEKRSRSRTSAPSSSRRS